MLCGAGALYAVLLILVITGFILNLVHSFIKDE
jgi:hypothetical protein